MDLRRDMPNYYSFNTAQQIKFHLYDDFEE